MTWSNSRLLLPNLGQRKSVMMTHYQPSSGYKTPYFINSHCLILSFALGKSLLLRTILGTPSLEAMHGVLDLSDRTLALKRLGITLPLVMTEPCPWFPPTTNYALQTGSLLTASKSSNDNRSNLAKGDASKLLIHPSHLSNLVVTDSWENNTFSPSLSQSRNPSALWPVSHYIFTTISSCLRTLCPVLSYTKVRHPGTKNINNKVKLISFSSCSSDSFNCSSNLFWNTDCALLVQTVNTKHINRKCKVPRRLPIEDRASVNSKATTSVLTCSCSSLSCQNESSSQILCNH